MTTKKNLVKTMLMSILTVGVFTFSFTSCSDDLDSMSDNNPQAPDGAKTELLEAYGLTFENFISESDVIILNADTTQLSVSKAYAEKMGITSFVNHPMGIWHRVENLPYIRKATSEKIVGDRFILDVVPATVAEIIGDKKVNMMTDIYVNTDAGSVKTRAAGNNIPEYSAKYIDENDVLHPAYIHLTDPYGYDTDYNTEDDQPSAAQTRAAQSGEYQYMSAEEIAAGRTRWSANNRIISFDEKIEKEFNFPVGKGSKDSVFIGFDTQLKFGLNYFITLDGGIKWNWIIPEPYVKKFEAGLDGNFGIDAGISLGFKKEWELDKDKWKKTLFTFKGYTFTFWVGPVPVAITTDPHLDIALDGKVSGALQMDLKYEYANRFKAGFGKKDGEDWYGITEFKEEKNKLTYEPPHIEISAEAGVGLYLACDVAIYGLAGPELAVGPRLGANLDVYFSPAEERLEVEAAIKLTVNAVVGAKLKVLGYELAESHLTFKLAGPWTLWKFNWEAGDDDEIHKTPEEQKQEEMKNLYLELLNAVTVEEETYDNYEKTATMLMEMDGYDRQQVEEQIYEKMKWYVPSLEYTTDKDQLKKALANAIASYYKTVSERFNAYLIEKSWNEVAEELQECPAYKENARHWSSYYRMDIRMDFLHRYFVSENNREPAKTKEDLETLAYYVLTYSKIAYLYTPGFQSKFTGVVEHLIEYGHTFTGYSEKQIEMAAYETLLEMNRRYPASSFANVPWSEGDEYPIVKRFHDEYERFLDRVQV